MANELRWYGEQCLASIATQSRTGMKLLKRAAKESALAETPDFLKRTLHVELESTGSEFGPDSISVRMWNTHFLANWWEFGGRTKPHIIRARRAAALSFFWGKHGYGEVMFKLVHHPGSYTHPHGSMRRAMDSVGRDLKYILS